jgi:hypothetical protein
VIRTAEIFSFFGDAVGTLPRFSGMTVLDFRFMPNVSIVEGSSGLLPRMAR